MEKHHYLPLTSVSASSALPGRPYRQAGYIYPAPAPPSHFPLLGRHSNLPRAHAQSSPPPPRQEDGDSHDAARGDLRGHRGGAPGGVHGGGGGRGDHHLPEAPAPAAPQGVAGRGVRHVRGGLGGGRVVPALRLRELPLHPVRVRLPPLRPPRHGVPPVPLAAQPALLPAQVRRGGAAADVERQEGDVRGGLAGAEPVRVAAVHDPRRGAGCGDHGLAAVGEDRPVHHRHVRGVQRDAGLLPDALPGGHRRREGRPRAQARPDRPIPQLARRRRARLRLMALVAAHRPHAALGLYRGGRQGDEGHGPDGGLHHGAQHLGKMGRRQPRPDQHQSLLPGHLPLSLQGTGMGRVGEEDVHGGDGAAEQHGAVPGRADPAAGHHPDRPRRHGQAGLPAGLHLPVAAQEGRAPDQVRRRNLRPGLHTLVHRRPPGHLEHTLLRRAHRPGPIDSFIQ